MRPLLRWAGSKKKLVGVLSQYWTDSSRRYVEPFAGSATLFFHLQPRKALLSDVNPDLISFYKFVKRNPELIYERALTLSKGKVAYYATRKIFNEERPASLSKATNFFYLNRNCFNGIFRTNAAGDFNVPYSGQKTGEFPSWAEFEECSRLLQRARIVHKDFKEVLTKNVEKNDWVYLDPPYAVENRRIFRQYSAVSFGYEDLRRLAETLEEIHTRKAHFVLSYAQCREATDFFGHWYSRRVYCQRNISGFTAQRRRAAEMIYSNIKIKT
jgi:DNA adenine methylase